jgi:hypothetical protein
MLIPLCKLPRKETVAPVPGAQNCIAQTIREMELFTQVFLTEALIAKLAARWQSCIGSPLWEPLCRAKAPHAANLETKN